MESKYTLGAFSFDTKEEYEQAKRELSRIAELKKRFDFENPDDAKKLLDAISGKPELFKTAVGKAFIRKLKRAVKDNTASGIDSNAKHTETEQSKSVQSIPAKRGISNVPSGKNKKEWKDKGQVVFPIIMETNPVTNVLFIVGFFLSFFGMFYSARCDEEAMSSVGGAVTLAVFIIGIANLCGISKRKKKADKYIYNHLTAEQKKALETEKEENKEAAEGVRFLLKIVMLIVAIAIPPLFVVLVIALLVMGVWPKIKWVFNNIKSGIALVVYIFAFALAGGIQDIYEDQFHREMPLAFGLIITAALAVGTFFLIKRWHKRQFYLAICNMASFPFMVFLALLPFIAVAGMMYIRANMQELTGSAVGMVASGNSNGGGNPNGGSGPGFIYDVPPVYQVSGYSYYNSNGTLVVVGPYPRTMPDASIYNNLSYRG